MANESVVAHMENSLCEFPGSNPGYGNLFLLSSLLISKIKYIKYTSN